MKREKEIEKTSKSKKVKRKGENGRDAEKGNDRTKQKGVK